MDWLLNLFGGNWTILIVVGLVLFAVMSGGSGATDLILQLLRAMKIIPQPDPPKSEQIFAGHTRKAWRAAKAGNLEGAKTILQAGVQATEAAIEEEEVVQPKGIMDKLTELMKSPLVWIVLGVGLLLMTGNLGGGCAPKPAPTPAPQVSS